MKEVRGFNTILFFILLVAKIWGKLDISWVLVFAPFWVPLVLALLILIFVGLFVIFGGTKT